MLSPQRFHFLDGVRGLAALAVVWLHAAITFNLDWVPIHAGLAVDLFFCLSGFVIAHSYDDRLRGQMGFADYAKRRLVRLYPMIVAGAVLGFFAWPPAPGKAAEILGLSAAAAALLPVGILMDRIAFPVNYPMWSLFFEVLASLGFGLIAARASSRLLAVVAGLCGVVLAAAVFAAGQITTFGVHGGGHFLMGFPRVAYPFIVGVLIHRYDLPERLPNIPAPIIVTAIIAVLLAPIGEHPMLDVVAVLFLLPAAVAFGARVVATGLAARACDWLGEISYPLYLVHLPILLIAHRLAPQSGAVAAIAAGVAVIVAWIALVAYDRPVRRWLSRLRSPAIHAPEGANP